jgi:hypothetical protein
MNRVESTGRGKQNSLQRLDDWVGVHLSLRAPARRSLDLFESLLRSRIFPQNFFDRLGTKRSRAAREQRLGNRDECETPCCDGSAGLGGKIQPPL